MVVVCENMSNSSLVAEIKEKQALDPILMKIKEDVGQQKVVAFEIGKDSILRYQGKLCVPDVDGYWLREKI